jgi:hypothetical protein
MDLNFKPNEYLMHELQDEFNTIGTREAMFLDHYDLSEITTHSAEEWKEFLKHPLVADFLQEELVMFKDKQIRAILRDAKDLEKSVGVAQVINSLSKLDLTQMGNNNKIFIYTYVPLDEQEQHAENVREAPSDVFSL